MEDIRKSGGKGLEIAYSLLQCILRTPYCRYASFLVYTRYSVMGVRDFYGSVQSQTAVAGRCPVSDSDYYYAHNGNNPYYEDVLLLYEKRAVRYRAVFITACIFFDTRFR